MSKQTYTSDSVVNAKPFKHSMAIHRMGKGLCFNTKGIERKEKKKREK